MLARSELERSGHIQGDSCSFGRKSGKGGAGHCATAVAVDYADDTDEPFCQPEGNSNLNIEQPFVVDKMEMQIEGDSCKCGPDNVKAQEGLVKGMSKDRWGLDKEEDHGQCRDGSGKNKLGFCKRSHKFIPTSIGDVADGMSKGLKHHDTAEPPVDEIVGIEGNSQKRNQGVVSASKQEEWYHISDRQDSCSVSKLREDHGVRLRPIYADNRKADVASK